MSNFDIPFSGGFGGSASGNPESDAPAVAASPRVILKTPKESCQTSTVEDPSPAAARDASPWAHGDAWPVPDPKPSCVPGWATAACGCKAWAYEAGCHKLSCEYCAPTLRLRRQLAIRDRFEGPNGRQGKPALYTVLTVVPERRAAAADPATWKKWRRAIWKFIRKNMGGLFAVERTDPCGDRAPEKWHPHLNFLWVQRDGFRPFIDVEALRAEWARITGAERTPSIHHAYGDQPARLNHWYSYMGRTWPAWQGSVKSHLSVRWLGKYPKKTPPETACPECGERIVFVIGLDKKGADELAALGPAAVRWEAEKREIESGLRHAERNGWN